jgi:hypothetical protein
VLYFFLLAGFGAVRLADRICPDEHGETRTLERSGHNRVSELKRRGIFYFFRSNPLKSPDSTKGIQGNASFFPWIHLDLLARKSPSGCIRG